MIVNIWCYIKMPLQQASRCYFDEVDQSRSAYENILSYTGFTLQMILGGRMSIVSRVAEDVN